MNMPKLGTVSPVGSLFSTYGNPRQQRDIALRSIHYAYFRKVDSGIVRGTVSCFTYLSLQATPSRSACPTLKKLFRLEVTRSRSVSNRDKKTAFQNAAMQLRYWPTVVLFLNKILFHPFQWVCGLFYWFLLVSGAYGKFPLAVGVACARQGGFPTGFVSEVAGFDFGTSPHGLSADLPLANQETPEAASSRSLAKLVLIFIELLACRSVPPAAERGRNAPPAVRLFACETFAGRGQS